MKTRKTLEVTFADEREASLFVMGAFPLGPGRPEYSFEGNRVLFPVQRRSDRKYLRFVATMCGGACRTLIG